MRAPLSGQRLAVLLVVGGGVGLVLATVLLIEKVRLLEDPAYVPTCSLNPVLSCGSIMTTSQAEVFGFPNPILGIVGFTIVATTGVCVLAAARLPSWYWSGLLCGAAAGAVFVHWLAFQSLYRIGALCPYCVGVWVVTIALFWYLLLSAAVRRVERWAERSAVRRVVTFSVEFHGSLLTLWYLAIGALAVVEFWDYWVTLG